MGETGILSYAEQKKNFVSRMKQETEPGKINVYLIIVANTLDPSIGEGCKKDIDTITKIFKSLEGFDEFILINITIAGADYSKEKIDEITGLLRPGLDDVVVFYYTGHGFRFPDGPKTRHPRMYLRPTLTTRDADLIRDDSLNLKDVYTDIVSKGARLNLVIGDCCNNKIEFELQFKREGPELAKATKILGPPNLAVYKKFFCDPKSSILVAAADVGQKAIVDEDDGSIFTSNFTDELLNQFYSKNADPAELKWDNILTRTAKKTTRASKGYDIGGNVPGNQEPFFDIQTDLRFYS